MTLAQLQALDFAAVWASISSERQAEIGAMVLRQECANQVAQDGGYDTTEDERGEAEAVSGEVLNALPAVIWAAIPDVLPTLYDDPYPMWQVMGRAGKGEPVPMILVRGLPRRRRPVLRGSTCSCEPVAASSSSAARSTSRAETPTRSPCGSS